MKDVSALIEHVKRTGRLKLLPAVLRELRMNAARQTRLSTRVETVADNPSLLCGSRTIENGTLTDRTGKSALIEIYKKITA